VEASRGAGDDGDEPSSLSADPRPAAASPDHGTTLPLAQGAELLPSSPWQSESLLAESWSTVGDALADREEIKSLDGSNSSSDSGGGGPHGAAGEERSDNHSSLSDMVHLEKEEAEMLMLAEAQKVAAELGEEDEEEEELQSSVLSVLGGDSELAELREEEELDQATRGTAVALLEEEPLHRSVMQVVPPMALPPLPIVRLEPPSSTSTPVPAPAVAEPEQQLQLSALQAQLHPPPVLAAAATGGPEEGTAGGSPPLDRAPHPVEEAATAATAAAASHGAPAPAEAESEEKAGMENTGPKKQGPERSPGELPMMLCGGAALVAVVGVVAYGALVYSRK